MAMDREVTMTLNLKRNDIPPGLQIKPDFTRRGHNGIVVDSINPEENTERNCPLKVKDRIIEINGIDIQNTNFLRARKTFMTEIKNEDVCLKIIRDFNKHLAKGMRYAPNKPSPLTITSRIQQIHSELTGKEETVSTTEIISNQMGRDIGRSTKRSPTEEPSKKYEIELVKRKQLLGFSVTSYPVVSGVMAKGTADGKLKVGDRILMVNGVDMTDKTKDCVLSEIRAAPHGSRITIVVEREEQDTLQVSQALTLSKSDTAINKVGIRKAQPTKLKQKDKSLQNWQRKRKNLGVGLRRDDSDSGISETSSLSSRMPSNAADDVVDFALENLWDKCIQLKDQTYGFTALRGKHYPGKVMLQYISKQFGNKCELTIKTCDAICSLIKGKHESIVHVWAAVIDKSEDIVFVVIVNDKDVSLDDFIEYSFVKRETTFLSLEGKEIIYNKQFDEWWAEVPCTVKERLTKCINKYNIDLMRNHKYLTMISVSPVRSTGYNSECHEKKPGACIALYVLMKGYIPIQETPFETHYDGFPVDVREGSFSLFTGRPNAFHDNLKSGCQIQREKLETEGQFWTGTLGGFIDYHGYGTCGLTCAHVLLHETEIINLAPPEGEDKMELGYAATGHSVCQPFSVPSQNNAVGKIVKAIYHEGGGGKSGIDIAVFQIEQRTPNLGEFPTLEDGTPLNLFYDSGKTADYSRLGSGTVLKFGAESYLTMGSLVTDTATTSVKLYETYKSENPYNITLHNLLEVRASSPNSRFAKEGDSGAFVFCTGENNGLYCVGVVEGGTTQDTCVVMPIFPILEQLNLTTLKCFENNRIEDKFAQLNRSISHDISRLETRIIGTEQNMQSAIVGLSQAIHSVIDTLKSFENNVSTRLQNIEDNQNNVSTRLQNIEDNQNNNN